MVGTLPPSLFEPRRTGRLVDLRSGKSAVANWNVPMGKKWRYILYIYAAGALIMEATLILDAYGNGGFQRQHSVTDLIVLAALYLAVAALWPLLIVILTLVYFGV